MGITKKLFGTIENEHNIYIYTLENSKGMKVSITNYGGAITSCIVPDKDNNFVDVVLGYDNLNSYINGDKFFGALIGRFGNRIKNGKFTLNGQEYSLTCNDGPNHLHGGPKGFDKVIWNASTNDNNTLKLSYLSVDGEEGYPGNLNVTVCYSLTDRNELEINYSAVCDSDTILNLTNHTYFNLSGHSSGDVLKQKLMINADNFTINDKLSIPTGKICSVKNTPMDFTIAKEIGQDINADYEQLAFGNGFDHNWVLNTKGDLTKKAAHAFSELTGIALDMYTTQPGVQFYSANFLDGSDIGKDNTSYNFRNAFCLETQHFPDCINHPNFASPILKAGEQYNQKTIYKFSINK
ncbi:MAG: galactose mutarotase [Clostridium butyricum]|nr:galactose mutarotase [Clostridium butyricum]